MSYRKRNSRGQMNIDLWTVVVWGRANTYQKIEWKWADINSNNFYVDDGHDRILYTWAESMCMLMNLVSDVNVDRVCSVNYAVYINSRFVDWLETLQTFVNPSKYQNISTASIIDVKEGNNFEIWVKFSEDDVTMTINSLKLILFWER